MSIERSWSELEARRGPQPLPQQVREPEVESSAPLPASVLDEAAQRDLVEQQVHEQSRGLNASARHAKHDAPGAAPTTLSEDRRVRGETQSLADLLAYCGQNLLSADGAMIGEIESVYADETTGDPTWLGAIAHGLRKRHVIVPVRGSYLFAGAISVPYSREQALLCESVEGAPPDPARAEHLRRFYGIPEPGLLAEERESPHDAGRLSWWGVAAVVILAAAVGAAIVMRRRVGR